MKIESYIERNGEEITLYCSVDIEPADKSVGIFHASASLTEAVDESGHDWLDELDKGERRIIEEQALEQADTDAFEADWALAHSED